MNWMPLQARSDAGSQWTPELHGDFASDLLEGLGLKNRKVPSKYLYDSVGCALFDEICQLPEYYPARCEVEILMENSRQISSLAGKSAELIGLGSGASRKAPLLLNALAPRRYVPVDVSGAQLEETVSHLRKEYRWLDIQPLVADYTRLAAVQFPPAHGSPRLAFLLGSRIGNLEPNEAMHFLRSAADVLAGGALLVGVDLIKDPSMLSAAYNDARGVTAAFNLNLLVRANRELGANFRVLQFSHCAFYNPIAQRVEMHIVSRVRQEVLVGGRKFVIEEGDSIHTESSYKYTVPGFRSMASRAGFTPGAVWKDRAGRFSVHWLFAPAK